MMAIEEECLSAKEEDGRKRKMEMVSHRWILNLISIFKYIYYFHDRMLQNVFQGIVQEGPPKFSELVLR